MNETKTLHNRNSHFSKTQIKEFSILFIMLNFFEVALEKVEEISETKFLSDKNESLKKLLISLLIEGADKDAIQLKISSSFKKLIEEINDSSSIQIITKAKKDDAISDLLNELLADMKDLNNLKKIESLENELINNLDENSFSELVKLKSQINRE